MYSIIKAGAMALVGVSLSATTLAETELVVWVSGEPGVANVYDELAAQFEAANSDITVELVKSPSDLENPALIPALSAGEGPDLFMFGTGPGQPASIIDGGLVADLTGYFQQNNWADMIPANVIVQTSKNGKLWAIGNEVETTAMFYNKKIFTDAGIETPTTWDEMQSAVSALIDAGFDTPIGLGGADKWPISHWQSMMFGRYAGPDGINNTMFADGKWSDTPFLAAIERFQQMSTEGWFGPNPVAINYAELMNEFWAGNIPMTYTGPWVIPGALDILGDRESEYGVFQVPPFEQSQQVFPTESIGGGWYMRANSENKEAAVALLNHMFFTTEGRSTLLTGGVVPVGPLSESLVNAQIPRLNQDLAKIADEFRGNGTVPAFLDTITPANLTTATYDGLQGVLLDVMSPQDFVDELQREWEVAKKAGTIMAPGGLQ